MKLNGAESIRKGNSRMDSGSIIPVDDSFFQNIRERNYETRIKRLEAELAEKNKLLMETNRVHIENQRLQKELYGERETNQRLTEELERFIK